METINLSLKEEAYYTKNKLAKTLASLTRGGRNYVRNEIYFTVEPKGVTVETACRNDYGRVISNEDSTFVAKKDLPNQLGRKLYL